MTEDPVAVVANDLLCTYCGKVIVAHEQLSVAEPHMRWTPLPEGGWLFEMVEMHMANGMILPVIPPRVLHSCEPDPAADVEQFLREQSNDK